MELYHLRTFIAVAEEGNFTRAGQRVHATQPAVSAHIKALEQELGLILFLRTPRGVELTGAGRELVDHARAVIQATERLTGRAKSLQGEISGTLAVGLCATPGYLRVDELLALLAETCPGLVLNLIQCPSGVVLRDLAARELDAGFVFGPARPGMAAITLARPRYVVAAGPTLGELHANDPEGLSAVPWVLPTEACAFRTMLLALLEEHTITPARTIGADSEEVIRPLVTSGKALSLMREDEALDLEAKDEVRVVPGLGPYDSELNFTHLEGRGEDPAVRALADAVRTVWEQEG